MGKKVYNKRIARVKRKLERRTLPEISKKKVQERVKKKLKSSNKTQSKN